MTVNTNQLKGQEKHALDHSERKEATKEINADTYEKMREEVRNALGAKGPCHIPEHLKDPDYQYIFDIYDSHKPYKFLSNMSLGYEHVTHDQMPLYKTYLGQSQGGFSMLDDGGKIGVKYSDHQTMYMMRIPKERYKILQEIQEEQRNAPIEGLKSRPNKGNFFGEISIGSGNFTTQPPQR